MNKRLSDLGLDTYIQGIYENVQKMKKFESNCKADTPFIDGLIAMSQSNLVTIELLTRLLEKDQPACKCNEQPTIPPRWQLIGSDLPDKIVETLDLAEQLLKTDNDTMIINGYDKHSNLVRFGNLSQQIRNELANRVKSEHDAIPLQIPAIKKHYPGDFTPDGKRLCINCKEPLIRQIVELGGKVIP